MPHTELMPRRLPVTSTHLPLAASAAAAEAALAGSLLLVGVFPGTVFESNDSVLRV